MKLFVFKFFFCFLCFLVTAKLVKNSHIYVKTFFTFVKSTLNLTCNFFLPNFNLGEKTGKAATK